MPTERRLRRRIKGPKKWSKLIIAVWACMLQRVENTAMFLKSLGF